MKKTLAVVAGSLLALGAAGGIASADVPAQEMQQMISEQFAAQLGKAPDSVVCPGSMATKVGSSVTCQVTAMGETHPVTVSVASSDANGVQLSMQMG